MAGAATSAGTRVPFLRFSKRLGGVGVQEGASLAFLFRDKFRMGSS